MSGTGIPAAPGNGFSCFQLAAGGPMPAQIQVEWVGPFAPAEALFVKTIEYVVLKEDQEVQVSLEQMERLPPSDPFWWVIPA